MIDIKQYPPKKADPQDQCAVTRFLEASDDCYFFGDYRPNADWKEDEVKNQISNFKKSPLKRGKHAEYRYKLCAIHYFAQLLADFHKIYIKGRNKEATYVPIPPSKTKDDPEYDDRLLQVLQKMQGMCNNELDVRELVIRTENEDAAHTSSSSRLDPSSLSRKWDVNTSILYLPSYPKRIIIVDDVLTTGSSYKEMVYRLAPYYREKEVRFCGLFIARTTHDAIDLGFTDEEMNTFRENMQKKLTQK